MKITDGGSGSFENPEPGSYVARCLKVIDLGTQPNDFEGKHTEKRQILINWELTDELMTTGKPFVVSAWLTASTNEMATFRKFIDSWRGVAMTKEEAEGFDPKKLINAPCMVSLVLSPKGKVKVGMVSKLPKGTTAKPLINPTIYFSLDEFDESIFEILPDGLQKKIMQSPEFAKRKDAPTGAPAEGSEEDIPF